MCKYIYIYIHVTILKARFLLHEERLLKRKDRNESQENVKNKNTMIYKKFIFMKLHF
jgi:hypothetical protein